jgi:hypothetical protein
MWDLSPPRLQQLPVCVFSQFLLVLSRRSYAFCIVAVCGSPLTHISHSDVTRIVIHICQNCCRINCGASLHVARIGVDFASSKPWAY